MSRDIYASLSGAAGAWTQLEVLSNNLANTSTTGFKAQRVAFQVTGPSEIGAMYASPTALRTNMAQGDLEQTKDPYNLALNGQGFLMVDAGNGSPMLTRGGPMGLDANRVLVDRHGLPLLADGGPIEVPIGESLRISEDGKIYGSLSGELGQLDRVQGAASPAGANLWTADGPLSEATDLRVVQGSLEKSNVDPLGSMVELIEASRWFEAYQQAMQASDSMDQAALNLRR